MLSPEAFLAVVRDAPLVSIDLLLEDPIGRLLVGLRRNEPARGFWFVPGGRVRKGERLPDALQRIAKAELGLNVEPDAWQLAGVFEHHYPTNFAGAVGIPTHYVVLAHRLRLAPVPELRPDGQHRELRWLTPQELRTHPSVHPYTRAYAP
ncbi:MAG: GDP-mannose mannosyl hydrolase [Cyanobacteriota bacterium]|jgi:colanic acid biosynthesis protein WcaH|nr:GDP-mannose mannosyl hydrolase [Cyanobacteriota bacterium]